MKISINPKRYTTTRGHKNDKKLPVSKQQTSKQENPSGSPNKTKSWKINQAKLDEETKQHPNRRSQTHQAKLDSIRSKKSLKFPIKQEQGTSRWLEIKQVMHWLEEIKEKQKDLGCQPKQDTSINIWLEVWKHLVVDRWS